MVNAKVRVIGKEIVDAKLIKAEPNILAHNLGLVRAMLEWIKAGTAAATPTGPGHFGYHLKDNFRTDTRFEGIKTIGELKSPIQGYWREFGTLAHFTRPEHVHLTVAESRQVVAHLGGGGEPAFMTAHKTLAGARRLIRVWYGGLAKWWQL